MQAGFVFSFIILLGRLQEYAAENTAFVQDRMIIIFSVRLEVNSGSEQLNHNACVFLLFMVVIIGHFLCILFDKSKVNHLVASIQNDL